MPARVMYNAAAAHCAAGYRTAAVRRNSFCAPATLPILPRRRSGSGGSVDQRRESCMPDAPQPADAADILWFLPTHGDGRYLGTQIGARHVTLGYLTQIARAADDLGYFGVLLPTGRSCEDSWVIASAMVPLTQTLRFLVAVRPGLS